MDFDGVFTMAIHSISQPAPALFSSVLCYLPLADEVLPALKQGVIPLRSLPDAELPWLNAPTVSVATGVSERDYENYLRDAYQRLPSSLMGLLTWEQFVQQAATKRPQIERELRHRHRANTVTTQAHDWFVQRFMTDPYSLAAWQQTAVAFASIWLAIDAQAWPQATLQSVQYGLPAPPSFPQRIGYDPEGNRHLNEQRLAVERTQVRHIIHRQGRSFGLLRLPPNALRAVLLGSELNAAFKADFIHFWRGDFRYQRIPLFEMTWIDGELGWSELMR